MSREIPLSRGLVAIVDDADFDWLNQWKWHAVDGKGCFYARRREPQRGPYVRMHNQILPDAEHVDHRNRNSLDNRRENLRTATFIENMQNRRSAPSASGYRGVKWLKKCPLNPWEASIGRNHAFIGTFATAEDAARARDRVARDLYGDFAVLNFPEEAA